MEFGYEQTRSPATWNQAERDIKMEIISYACAQDPFSSGVGPRSDQTLPSQAEV